MRKQKSAAYFSSNQIGYTHTLAWIAKKLTAEIKHQYQNKLTKKSKLRKYMTNWMTHELFTQHKNKININKLNFTYHIFLHTP
jgi:hypothetical protein